MRISVSGTHFIGKSTLIDDFLRTHPDYISDQESYYKLLDEKDVEDSLEPSFECLLEQLDYSIKQLEQSVENDNIIFDRCPVDFVAYAMSRAEENFFDLNDSEFSERFPKVIKVLQTLDLIIFLPITQEHPIIYIEENPAYRIASDKNFKKIYREDAFNLFPDYNHPKIIEVWGDPQERIRKIESYL